MNFLIECRICGRPLKNKRSRAHHERRSHSEEEIKKIRKYRDKTWLYDRYVKKIKSVNDIAEELDCSISTICVWLKKHGIKIREQSETLRLGGKVKGENNPMYGKHHTEKTKKKIREKIPDKYGKDNPFYGKKHTVEMREKLSEIKIKHWIENPNYRNEWLKSDEAERIAIQNLGDYTNRGSNNPNWCGGISLYLNGWKVVRREIKKRDNYTCQNCGTTQRGCNKLGIKLHVHHRDGDTKNDKPENLTTLCAICHGVEQARIRANWTNKWGYNH